MGDYSSDKRIVLTLDAGGTNFRFSAVCGRKVVTDITTMPSHGDNLDRCLSSIIEGFQQARRRCPGPPAAISFAFPGPADYPNGIIGDLGNLPAFRGGVALGPLLQKRFGVPVFINNDGDLFAYGEAIAGFLPYVNAMLAKAGSPKRYHNLLGVTLGTGFGAGIVRNGVPFLGDNSMAGEIWLLRNKLHPGINCEESVSARGIRRTYAEQAGIAFVDAPEPRHIFAISQGKRRGHRLAARKAFEQLGEVAGDAMAHALTLVDGLAVVGGGLSGAGSLILPAMVRELNATFDKPSGGKLHRLGAPAYNLEVPAQRKRFAIGKVRTATIPGTGQRVKYDADPRIGVGLSRLGTSQAVAIGAYAFALDALDR
jgi:glucokinase